MTTGNWEAAVRTATLPELAALVTAGPESLRLLATNCLLERLRKVLYLAAIRVLQPREDFAEDATQNGLLKLYRDYRLRFLAGLTSDKFEGYVSTTGKREALSIIRLHRKQKESGMPDGLDNLEDQRTRTRSKPPFPADREKAVQAMQDIVWKLIEEHDRELWLLHRAYYEGASRRAMAEQDGITYDNLRARLSRAVRKVVPEARRLWEEAGYDTDDLEDAIRGLCLEATEEKGSSSPWLEFLDGTGATGSSDADSDEDEKDPPATDFLPPKG